MQTQFPVEYGLTSNYVHQYEQQNIFLGEVRRGGGGSRCLDNHNIAEDPPPPHDISIKLRFFTQKYKSCKDCISNLGLKLSTQKKFLILALELCESSPRQGHSDVFLRLKS